MYPWNPSSSPAKPFSRVSSSAPANTRRARDPGRHRSLRRRDGHRRRAPRQSRPHPGIPPRLHRSARYFLLPNTAGCYTADEAIRAARLAREVGISDWVKIEVIGDQATLYPDVQATLEATRILVKEGFTVLPYTSDDIVFAHRLIDAGAAAVMPLAAPIGSGLGIQNRATLQILREKITAVPLIVDAGVGTASDAALAMEMGADAVLMNTAIAAAANPILMAEAMQHAVLAGRQAHLAGRMPRRLYATASSPLEGVSR